MKTQRDKSEGTDTFVICFILLIVASIELFSSHVSGKNEKTTTVSAVDSK